MSFYKLENADSKKAKEVISTLDEEDKKRYLLKAVNAPYISDEVFSLLVTELKNDTVTLTQVFSEIVNGGRDEKSIEDKLNILKSTGIDFSRTASQTLMNGAYKMNAQTVTLLIESGADPSYSNNSALRSALEENNTPVINELLKYSNNSTAYQHFLNHDYHNSLKE